MTKSLLRRRIAASAMAAALASAAVFGPAVLGPAGTASASPSTFADTHRGDLVSVTPVASLTPAELKAALGQIPLDTAHVTYAVDAYRIVYRTIDVRGHDTTASGLVVLPDRPQRRLEAIEYEHGTNPDRADVASVTAGGGDRELAELFASTGYLAVAPDYLGLGEGPGYHPYVHAASEVSASVDMLPAAATLAAREGHIMDTDIDVTGFSQGGHAAMAIGQALTSGHGPWRLRALAPISGPYAIQHIELPALLDHPGDGPGQVDPGEGVFYIAFWTVSMNRIYHLYSSPSQVFQAPYDRTVEQLFDGYHDEGTIAAGLPASPAQLLTPAFQQWLRHPTGALLRAVQENDQTCQWRPHAPVELFAAENDRDVPMANAYACQAQLRAHGASVPVIDVGPTDHFGSVIAAAPRVLDWFLSQDGRDV